jgi:hypothetical protein
MPIPAKSLVQHQLGVHSILLDDPLSKADELMVKYRVKQIPIVDANNKPSGLITSAIIATLKSDYREHFFTLVGKDSLKSRVAIFHAEQDIFELLNELNDISAILLTNDNGQLIHIITKRDTLVFFRQRAEELVLIEYIENSLKTHIKNAYEDEELQKEIDEYVGNRKKTDSYLRFLKEAVVAAFKMKGHDVDILDDELHNLLNEQFTLTKQKGFTDLSFDNFINIILKNWERFEANFQRNTNIWRIILEDVRDIRNKLFHFKGEISDKEREKLHSCASWLEEIPNTSAIQPTKNKE